MSESSGTKPNERFACGLIAAGCVIVAACGELEPAAAPSPQPVVGASYVVSSPSGYVATELPVPSGFSEGIAYDVNSSGVIVGKVFNPPQQSDRAVKWVNGQPVLLPFYPGQASSRALGINKFGNIAGEVTINGVQNAVVWSGNTVALLPYLGGGSSANDISDSGVVVGWEHPNTLTAVKWVNGQRISIHPPGWGNSWANAVSLAGDVVGAGHSPVPPPGCPFFEPVRWKPNGQAFATGMTAPNCECEALDVNASLKVTGRCTIGGGAFTWDQASGMQQLKFWWTGEAISVLNRLVGAEGAFAVTRRNGITDTLPHLGPPGNFVNDIAYGVNTCGTIVGVVEKLFNNNFQQTPVIWQKPWCDS